MFALMLTAAWSDFGGVLIMFYFQFKRVPRPSESAAHMPHVGVPTPPITAPAAFGAVVQHTEVYQICENGHALSGLVFYERSQARMRLRSLVSELQYASAGWYRVEQRLARLPVRDILGVRRIYADGHSEVFTYTIRRISLEGAGV